MRSDPESRAMRLRIQKAPSDMPRMNAEHDFEERAWSSQPQREHADPGDLVDEGSRSGGKGGEENRNA